DALPPVAFQRRLGTLVAPLPETRQDFLGQQGRRPGAPVFPWEIAEPVAPFRIARALRQPLARQAEIGDRHDAPVAVPFGAIAISESIKLLDIAQRMMRLALDPGAQADLQGRMVAF